MSPAQPFQATCPSSETVGAEDRAAACARVRGCVPSASVVCLPKRTRRNRKRYRDRGRAKAGDSAHTLMPDVDLRLEAPRSCVSMTPTAPPLPCPEQADAGRPSLQLQCQYCLLYHTIFFFRAPLACTARVECRRASAPRRSRSPRCAVVPPAERVCDTFAAAACASSTHRRTSVSRSCKSSSEHVKRAETDGGRAGGEARAEAQGSHCGDHPRMS